MNDTLNLMLTEKGWEAIYQECLMEVAVLDLVTRLFTPPWETFPDRFPLT